MDFSRNLNDDAGQKHHFMTYIRKSRGTMSGVFELTLCLLFSKDSQARLNKNSVSGEVVG